MKTATIFALMAFTLLTPNTGLGGTYTVTNTNDSGPGSLRQAVLNANTTVADDEIVFQIPGCPDGVCIIVLTETTGALEIKPAVSAGTLTISNPSGPGRMIISGNREVSFFFVDSGAHLTINGVTMERGYGFYILGPYDGGALLNSGHLVISNSVFRSNNASRGGAIYNEGGSVMITTSKFVGNWAEQSGGAIYSSFGNLMITESEIVSNGALEGGGIYSVDGTVLVRDTTIANNTAYYGGGIWLGAHAQFSWTATFANSTLSGNQAVTTPEATGVGGAVYLANTNVPVKFTNTTVTNNAAFFGGGVSGDGLVGATIDLRNSIVSGNQAQQFPEISTNVVLVNDRGNNIVGGSALLGPLRNNGGPTRTHALRPGSPAIDAGNDCVLTANGCGDGNPALLTDQRGMARNGTVDIGAFEQQNGEVPGTTPFDFDGDGKADPSVFRPDGASWYVLGSQAGFFGAAWGTASDRLVPADYDGDGKTDFAINRHGVWWILNSDGSGYSGTNWGLPTDIPVPADYDGDGKADLAIVRDGVWWILNSDGSGYNGTQWGLPTDIPVPADYDGDGKADLAIVRDGVWWILNSNGSGYTGTQWGLPTDIPVPADYDGDGKTDLAIVRDGVWWILNSNGSGYTGVQWGIGTDKPVPADYDGDGKADPAVFRDGNWYILNSDGTPYTTINWGLASDIPIPIRQLSMNQIEDKFIDSLAGW